MADRRTLDEIENDFREARLASDRSAMARLRNEEACVVLLTLLGRLAADDSTFIHEVALKGGILMAGELGSPRVSADIDATTGAMRRMDPERIVGDLRSVGRDLDVRQRGALHGVRFMARSPIAVVRWTSVRVRHGFQGSASTGRTVGTRHSRSTEGQVQTTRIGGYTLNLSTKARAASSAG